MYSHDTNMPFVCHSVGLVYYLYVVVCYLYVTRITGMLSLCHSHVSHSYVTRMYSYEMVCHLYVLVCHPYVIRLYSHLMVCLSNLSVYHPYVALMHWYVIGMSLVCTRMSSVCHSYVSSYVIRLPLVCGFIMNRY